MTDTEGVGPVPNSTRPFWRTERHELDLHRSTPELPAEADVVIIGAGYSGAAFAHYLYEDNPSPPSVLILEAREACSGATARNGQDLRFLIRGRIMIAELPSQAATSSPTCTTVWPST